MLCRERQCSKVIHIPAYTLSLASSDNKRVAKNAVALTLRMVLVTIVGLYTSRVVLQALGVDDYGIYGVIGGVVGMASFLNASMAGATSRFITFELGRGDHVRLRTIFSSALIIHFVIALVVAILAETVGLWFVNNCMNFPAGRMPAVNILYQFTILSMFVSFTQVPYSAAIIAHERMNIYAYFEILNVILKLGIVFLLLAVDTDRLILYAALLLVTSILMATFYRIYSLRHFPECHFTFCRDNETIREMLKFAGLDLYGNMCVIAKTQGQPIILNIFFGVIANAGASIALTISGAVNGLTTNIMQAFRPQIIKQFSSGHIVQCETFARSSAQFTIFAFTSLAIPVLLEADALIELWLGQVPLYSVEFIRVIIITSLFSFIINVNNACIHATGNIKGISFISGNAYLLCPVLTYLWMKNGGSAVSGYIVDAIMMAMIAGLGFVFIKKQIPRFPLCDYTGGIIRSLSVFVLSLFITGFALNFILNIPFMQTGDSSCILQFFTRLFISSLIGLTVVCCLTWALALGKNERQYAIELLSNFCKKFAGISRG